MQAGSPLPQGNRIILYVCSPPLNRGTSLYYEGIGSWLHNPWKSYVSKSIRMRDIIQYA